MAQKDNTLGAPTEGLGQTVTFTAGGGGGTPQTTSRRRQAMRTGQVGGAVVTSQAAHIPDTGNNGTFAALAKLADGVIQPLIERERTAAYVRGMQRAAQGEAITEIVDEQPWFSQLFGATSLVDGARAYTASAKAASVAADMEAKMPDLRKLSASEFGDYATKAITTQTTGDATTDMLITQQLSTTLPAVMKGQAKAHMRFQQEQLETSIQSSQESTFALLGTVDAESRKPGATRDSSDVLETTLSTAKTVFAKPAEMKQELHDKLLGESAIKAISGGNFAVYNLLKDSGKLAQLEPQMAYNVNRTYQQASTQAKLNVPDQLLQKVADFRTMARQPGMTDEDILTAAKAIDDEYYQMTGDKGGFIGKASTLAEMQQLREYRDAQQAAERRAVGAARDKAGKEQAELQQVFSLASRVVSGDGTQPYLMFSETPKEQQAVFDHVRATASPDTRLRVLVGQYQVATDKVEKAQNESAIAQALKAGDPALLHKVYVERYLPLVRAGGDLGTAVAEEYAGAYGDKMAKYHSIANGGPVAADMQGAIYNEVVLAPKPLTATPRNKEVVKELTTGRIMSLFTQPVHDPEGYAAMLEPKMKSWLDVPEAVADARKNATNVSLVGGYHWAKGEGKTDLTRWVLSNKVAGGVAADTIDKAFSNVVASRAAEAGIEGKLMLGQTVDTPDGQPQMYVMGTGSDGAVKLRMFKASDIHADWQAGKDRLTSDDLKFGPKLTNVPSDEQPSIYAPAAEWEAYRKKQAAKPK